MTRQSPPSSLHTSVVLETDVLPRLLQKLLASSKINQIENDSAFSVCLKTEIVRFHAEMYITLGMQSLDVEERNEQMSNVYLQSSSSIVIDRVLLSFPSGETL